MVSQLKYKLNHATPPFKTLHYAKGDIHGLFPILFWMFSQMPPNQQSLPWWPSLKLQFSFLHAQPIHFHWYIFIYITYHYL